MRKLVVTAAENTRKRWSGDRSYSDRWPALRDFCNFLQNIYKRAKT